MTMRPRFVKSLLSLTFILCLFALYAASVLAQSRPAAEVQNSTPLLTATAIRDRVRFAAFGEVRQLRLELFDAAGLKVFDSSFRSGNLLDWSWHNQQGAPLSDGQYLFLVSIENLSGQVSQKYGTLHVQQQQVLLQQTRRAEISAEQGKALDEGGQTLTQSVVDRVGAEIPTDDNAASKKTASSAASSGNDIKPEAALTVTTNGGTTNQLPVWSNGPAGELADSIITQTSGNIGIGLTNPQAGLEIFKANAHLRLSGAGISVPGGIWQDTSNRIILADWSTGTQGLNINTSTGNVGIGLFNSQAGLEIFRTGLQLRLNGTGITAPGGLWQDSSNRIFLGDWGTGLNGLSINASTGNVGIGTLAPTAKLHVAGNVNFTGLRTEPTSSTPNVLGGRSDNAMAPGVVGGTISGGGTASLPNRISDDYGTVGGGGDNLAGNLDGTTFDKPYATVGGGSDNYATGSYSTIGGGSFNAASGNYSTVPGGQNNIAEGEYAFAAGRRARASNGGSFVWADSTDSDFVSSANNQFLIRAGGGVGIGTNAPGYMLDVVGRSRIRQNAGQTGGTNTAGLWLFQNTPAADSAFVGMETDNSVGFFGNNGGGWGLTMNTQTGDVGIGTSAPDVKLSVNGHASKPGGGSWNVFSDERLKNIKGRFATGLSAVMKMQPVRYEYKKDNALDLKSEGEYIGFSAQAVQKVIPEAVTTNARGYLMVNNDPIMWTMLNAIKEQQAQIELQQKLIAEQQRQLNELKQIIKPRQTVKTKPKR